MGYRDEEGGSALEQFEHDLKTHRSRVRGIHEQLFYRPLLDAIAASPTVRLTAEEIARQLAAFGFRDVVSARRAVDELTGGLSRRSRLMRQTLPLVLDWLSTAPDPDLGLNQLRLLVTSTTDNAPLVAVLRDDPVAAEGCAVCSVTACWSADTSIGSQISSPNSAMTVDWDRRRPATNSNRR